MQSKRNLQQIIKMYIFQMITMIHTNTFTNPLILLCISVFQIILNHYFYLNGCFPHLKNYEYIKLYLDYIFPNNPLLSMSSNIIPNIIIISVLGIIPLVILLMLKFGKNSYITIIISIVVLIMPLISIKISLETIYLVRSRGVWVYLGSILIALGYIMLVVSLMVYNNQLKILDMILVILIEVRINQYALLIILLIRLILIYKFYHPPRLFKIYFELSLLVILITLYFTNDQITNFIAFGLLILSFTLLGVVDVEEVTQSNIYYILNEMQGNQENQNKVVQYLEKHMESCQELYCQCRTLCQGQKKQGLKTWVYNLQFFLLSKKKGFNNTLLFSEVCFNQYNASFKGLVNLCKQAKHSIIEQYLFYMICSKYEAHVRKGDRSQNDKRYQAQCQEILDFQENIIDSISKIKQFWFNMDSFDGSSKFIDLIVNISLDVVRIRKGYYHYIDKYQQKQQFDYIYDAFKAILLQNSKLIKIEKPKHTLFFISQDDFVIKVNRQTLNFLSISKQELLFKSYKNLIPIIYHGFHQDWVDQYIQNYSKESVKSKQKPIMIVDGLIKMVEMQNHIMPRFNEGIQIISYLKNIQGNQGIHILGNIQTMQIVCVDKAFMEQLNIIINQKNIHKIKQLKINDFFPKMNLTRLNDKKPPKDLMFNSKILEDPDNFFNIQFKEKEKDLKLSPKIFECILSQQPQHSLIKNYRVFHFQDINIFNPTIKYKVQQPLPTSNESTEEMEEIQSTNQSRMKFYLLYCIIFVGPIVLHFLYNNILQFYRNSLEQNQKYGNYWLAYIYTCLYHLKIQCGKNMLQFIKQLWIQGYGNNAQVFPSFQQFDDPHFYQFTIMQTCTYLHNQFYNKLINQMNNQAIHIKSLQSIMIGIIGLFIACDIVNLIMIIKQIIKVEQQVEQTIMIFLKIKAKDIKMIVDLIQDMQQQYFGQFHNSSIQQFDNINPFDDLLPNNSLIHGENSINHLRSQFQLLCSNSRRIGISYEKQKALDFLSQLSFYKKKNLVDKTQQQQREQCQQKVNKFLEKQSIFSKLISNPKQLSIIIVSNIIILLIFSLYFYFVIAQLNYISTNIQITDSVWKQPISILKSIQQNALSTQLQPISQFTLQKARLIDLVSSLPDTMSQFGDYLLGLETSNNCKYLNDSQIIECQQLYNGAFQLGQKVVIDKIFQIIRVTRNTTTFQNQKFTKFIQTQLKILQLSKQTLRKTLQYYFIQLQTLENQLMIINISGLLICLFALYFALRSYHNKIKNTQSLLTIIPKRIFETQLMQSNPFEFINNNSNI